MRLVNYEKVKMDSLMIDQIKSRYFLLFLLFLDTMEPLKELFNRDFYHQFANEFSKIDPSFEVEAFIQSVTKGLDERSLNERMRNTSVVLKDFLPADYEQSIELMRKVIPNLKKGYTTLIFPDFVSQFGKQTIDISLDALKYFTQFGSSEFAIRTFLQQDFNRTIQTMYAWAIDENHHVRRLASEGSRPRLPWSFKLPEVIKNPRLTQPILEQLKTDPELYVRKSVANHLNDFSKDNPAFMIDLVTQWDQSHPHTAWIVKHGTRTLIKKGNTDSLNVFGYEKEVQLKLVDFKLNRSHIKLGDTLQFDFTLVSEKSTAQKLVVDYVIHYRKNSGELSAKVFKLKEVNLLPNQPVFIAKKQLIKDFSTRKHYVGEHLLEIQINGKIVYKTSFLLEE